LRAARRAAKPAREKLIHTRPLTPPASARPGLSTPSRGDW